MSEIPFFNESDFCRSNVQIYSVVQLARLKLNKKANVPEWALFHHRNVIDPKPPVHEHWLAQVAQLKLNEDKCIEVGFCHGYGVIKSDATVDIYPSVQVAQLRMIEKLMHRSGICHR